MILLFIVARQLFSRTRTISGLSESRIDADLRIAGIKKTRYLRRRTWEGHLPRNEEPDKSKLAPIRFHRPLIV